MGIQEPQISIIIPVYNKGRYVEKILDMISKQTFSCYECIVVDDGSDDKSGKICDLFAEKDNRFIVIHTLNKGVSHARNIGLDMAQGKYITFIDADDEIEEEYLNNLYRCIEDFSVDLVISWFSQLHPSGELRQIEAPFPRGLYYLDQLLPNFAKLQKESGIFGWCWAKIFKKELIETNRFNENIKLAEDFDFYLDLYSKIEKIYFDDKSNYKYRVNADNSSVAKNDKDIDYLAQLNINLHFKEFLIKRNAWHNENKEIVERHLTNYVFFTLFHCQINSFEKHFDLLYGICEKNTIPLEGVRIYQKILLKLLEKNKKRLAKVSISLYRTIRKMKKR